MVRNLLWQVLNITDSTRVIMGMLLILPGMAATRIRASVPRLSLKLALAVEV